MIRRFHGRAGHALHCLAVNPAPPLRIADIQRNYLPLLIASKAKFVFIRLRILKSFSLLLIIIIIICYDFHAGCLQLYLKQTRSLGYIELLLFCIYMLHITLFPKLNVLYSYICTSSSVCAVRNTAVSWSSLSFYFPGTRNSCIV